MKVRRPGVVRQVALDNYCIQLLLQALKVYGVISEQTDISSLTAEVGSGLFRELNLKQVRPPTPSSPIPRPCIGASESTDPQPRHRTITR